MGIGGGTTEEKCCKSMNLIMTAYLIVIMNFIIISSVHAVCDVNITELSLMFL